MYYTCKSIVKCIYIYVFINVNILPFSSALCSVLHIVKQFAKALFIYLYLAECMSLYIVKYYFYTLYNVDVE